MLRPCDSMKKDKLPTPEEKRMSPEEFKEVIKSKGWTYKTLSARWDMTQNWVSTCAADEGRLIRWDDAVRGLPSREIQPTQIKRTIQFDDAVALLKAKQLRNISIEKAKDFEKLPRFIISFTCGDESCCLGQKPRGVRYFTTVKSATNGQNKLLNWPLLVKE